LPPGLTLNGNVISGVPTYPGSPFDEFTLIVTDSQTPVSNVALSNQQSIVVNLPTLLTVLSGPLPQGSVGASYNQTLVGTAGTPPYAWSISGGRLPAGLSINNVTGAITGTPTTTGTANFTVKITDSATPVANTATSNLSIVVQPRLSITTTSLPAGSLGTAYAESLQATGGVPPYNFSLSSGTLPAGLTLLSVIAGVPTTAGTSNFSVTAYDSQGATATGNLSIQINAANCPSNSSFQGNYAFQFSGPVSPVTSGINQSFVGTFIADGAGNISQGYADNGVNAPPANITGTYCMSTGNLGTLNLTGLPISPYEPPSTTTFEIALQANGSGSAVLYQNQVEGIGLNSPGFFSGQVLRQDTTAFNTTKITGNYAFGFVGGNYGQNITTHGGTFTADGAGNLTNGESDLNVDGVPTNVPTVDSSDLVVATTGRGSMTLNLGALGTTNVVFYVVNASQLVALETGTPLGSAAVVNGQILQRASGNFGNNSLSSRSVIGLQWRDTSLVGNDGPVAQAGIITWDGVENFTLTADQNDLGGMTSPSYSGTYTVAANGRVTLTASGQLNGAILYLTGPNQGFVTGSDLAVTSGAVFNQSGSTFNDAAFGGNYFGGNWQFSDDTINVEADALTSDGVGNVSGVSYIDSFVTSPNGPASSSVTGTYAVSSNGRGTITQSGATTGIFYVVSPTQILMIPNADPNPKVITLAH
jgi:hypothetical protein